ncbi:MAG TPA: 16S rRNA (guanine(966)-N(2))-methyltransferase RsmD [Balneolaceae bacterium]|nr:16S rRNA (guanine(966)-N(2))-methyltransferase RsmD [Balneolaceae bacterium]
MRIITGKLKGRKIPVPDSGLLRPTSDRAKEGIFSMIDARIYLDNYRILDLFSGSGSLGFEAISRGASHCTFVDNEALHMNQISKLARKFGVASQVRAVTSDVTEFLQQNRESYDLIFADPPYNYPGFDELVEEIISGGHLEKEGWFILEHDKYSDYSSRPEAVLNKSYGRTVVTIFVLPGTEF